jgi:hypothetical protein
MNGSSAKYLFNEPKHKTICDNVQLLRIILDPEQTRVDLGYQATSHYTRGGWVRMSDATFIRVHPDGQKLKITGSENIPIGKPKHEFTTTKDWLYFSLYFPPIPFKTCLIDLIEKDNSDGTDFNFYDIQLNISEAIKLL